MPPPAPELLPAPQGRGRPATARGFFFFVRNLGFSLCALHFNSISGLLIGAGILFFVGFLYETFRHRQGLGEGDAAVLGLIGMWVGWQGLGAVLLIAAVNGIIIGGITLLKNREKNQEFTTLLQTQIPFAPYLCLAGITVYLIQETGYRNFVLGFDYF